MFLLTSCEVKYPYNQPSGIWICEDPEISFEVPIDNQESRLYGKMKLNGEEASILCIFVPNYADFCLGGDVQSSVLGGSVDYEIGKLTVKVKKDDVFDGKYTELVFIRQDFPED